MIILLEIDAPGHGTVYVGTADVMFRGLRFLRYPLEMKVQDSDNQIIVKLTKPYTGMTPVGMRARLHAVLDGNTIVDSLEMRQEPPHPFDRVIVFKGEISVRKSPAPAA